MFICLCLYVYVYIYFSSIGLKAAESGSPGTDQKQASGGEILLQAMSSNHALWTDPQKKKIYISYHCPFLISGNSL